MSELIIYYSFIFHKLIICFSETYYLINITYYLFIIYLTYQMPKPFIRPLSVEYHDFL
jgi:hypothetical protein